MARSPHRQGRPPGSLIIDVIGIAYDDRYECHVANAYARRFRPRLLSGATGDGANAIGQRKNLATTGSGFDPHLVSTTATGPAYSWGYNSRGELEEASDTSSGNHDRAYQYDAIGNREKTADGLLGDLPTTDNYTANALNQYTTANGVSLPAPAYDADGNHTNGPLPVATGNATLVWDAENRLVQVTRADDTVITYSYDYLSRRISKKVGSATAERFLYDGWNPIAKYAGTTLVESYLWGMDLSGSMQGAGGVGGLLAVVDEAATGDPAYFPTYDGNGNVSEYLDASGAIVAHYEYDPFGNITVATGTKATDFAHRFSTKPLDPETGLNYYAYRYYDPLTGRWPSRDPIGERGGVNLYGFVENDGVNARDVLGMWPDGQYLGIWWIITWRCKTTLKYCCNGIWSEWDIYEFAVNSYTLLPSGPQPGREEDYDPENYYINPFMTDFSHGGEDSIREYLNDLSDHVHNLAYQKASNAYQNKKDSLGSCVVGRASSINCTGDFSTGGEPRAGSETFGTFPSGPLNPPIPPGGVREVY